MDLALGSRSSNYAIVTTLLLLGLILTWQLTGLPSIGRWLWAGLLAIPAALVLISLLRHRPCARSWTILGAIPYVVLGVTELIANPGARGWALACAAVAFIQFIALANLLRVQPPQRR
jgi:uncharacterized membrane protein